MHGEGNVAHMPKINDPETDCQAPVPNMEGGGQRAESKQLDLEEQTTIRVEVPHRPQTVTLIGIFLLRHMTSNTSF